jgi:hypothetical protein
LAVGKDTYEGKHLSKVTSSDSNFLGVGHLEGNDVIAGSTDIFAIPLFPIDLGGRSNSEVSVQNTEHKTKENRSERDLPVFPQVTELQHRNGSLRAVSVQDLTD